MLMLLRDTHYLRDLRLGDFEVEDAAYTLPFGMYLQHNLCGAHALHTENRFEYLDDEIHRCEIVIDKDDAIQRWLLDTRPSLLDGDVDILCKVRLVRFITHAPINGYECPGFNPQQAFAGYYIWANDRHPGSVSQISRRGPQIGAR